MNTDPKRTEVTLESPDGTHHDLGTWEVVSVGPGEVRGNNPDVGWIDLARWDHDNEGWRAVDNGELFDDLYVTVSRNDTAPDSQDGSHDFGLAVTEALQQRGYDAYYEYPGFVSLQLTDGPYHSALVGQHNWTDIDFTVASEPDADGNVTIDHANAGDELLTMAIPTAKEIADRLVLRMKELGYLT